MEIKIDIKDCSECPFWESERIYTADSFEMPYKWTCKKAKRQIAGFVEWHDKVKIPDWCPCRMVKTDNTESIYKKILESDIVYLNDKLIKIRSGKDVMNATTNDIRDAEIVLWDRNAKTLYLKTKEL